MLLGNQLRLEIFPVGPDAGEGIKSLFLDNMSDKSIYTDLSFSINDGNGKQVEYKRSANPCNFGPIGAFDSAKGFTNFGTRLTIELSGQRSLGH
jgi:hypothetical protein